MLIFFWGTISACSKMVPKWLRAVSGPCRLWRNGQGCMNATFKRMRNAKDSLARSLLQAQAGIFNFCDPDAGRIQNKIVEDAKMNWAIKSSHQGVARAQRCFTLGSMVLPASKGRPEVLTLIQKRKKEPVLFFAEQFSLDSRKGFDESLCMWVDQAPLLCHIPCDSSDSPLERSHKQICKPFCHPFLFLSFVPLCGVCAKVDLSF